MRTALCLLLLSSIALLHTQASKHASASNSLTPVIVARAKLTNQSAPIPATTIYTPSHDGLYRLTVYGSTTTPCPANCNGWRMYVTWSDDAGAESKP
jgi:hypothetical protein